MYMYATFSILLVVVSPILSLPYPIYGTQRYHRGGSPERSLAKSPPVYGSLPQYEDRFLSPSNGHPYPYDDNGYVGGQHEPKYMSYGLPTYRGEYKPSPYYYSPLPNYNYYDDRAENTNPMDDLHEEMLQEDERERQRQWPIGQETWYENAHRPAKLTSTFLQNLIAYNKQLGTNREQPEYESAKEVDPDDDYFNEDGTASDAYDPLSSSHNDYRYYENSNQRAAVPQSTQTYDRYPQVAADDDDEKEDEDVRELKSLAHRGRNEIKHNQNDYEPYEQQESAERNQWRSAQASADVTSGSEWQKDAPEYNKYDSEPEYDEGSWINWDRKRSVPQKQQESISLLALGDRKPTITVNDVQKQPVAMVQLTKATTQALSTPTSASTSTPSDYSSALGRLKLQAVHHQGQKEVFQPRPDTPLRNPFSATVMNFLEQSSKSQKSDHDKANSKDIYDTIKQIVSMEHNIGQVSYA